MAFLIFASGCVLTILNVAGANRASLFTSDCFIITMDDCLRALGFKHTTSGKLRAGFRSGQSAGAEVRKLFPAKRIHKYLVICH